MCNSRLTPSPSWFRLAAEAQKHTADEDDQRETETDQVVPVPDFLKVSKPVCAIGNLSDFKIDLVAPEDKDDWSNNPNEPTSV